MKNIDEKIKRLRKEVVKTFFLLFTPQVFVYLLTSQVTINPMYNLKWQLCWFTTYFSFMFLLGRLLKNRMVAMEHKPCYT